MERGREVEGKERRGGRERERERERETGERDRQREGVHLDIYTRERQIGRGLKVRLDQKDTDREGRLKVILKIT